MQRFSYTPAQMISSLWRNADLMKVLIKREVLGRYRGSLIGIFWSFFNPLLMLVVYTFVFGVVFKARWNAEGNSHTEFALVLFAGLIVFNLFAECVTRSPQLILLNVNYVKKVVFPLEILPCVALGSAAFHALVSWSVWIAAYVVLIGVPHLTVLLLPLVLLPLVLFILGVTWWLASLGVYLRDVSQIVGILVMALMFLSPIFYPISALPEGFRSFVALNPLTTVVEQTRDVMYWGRFPDWAMFGVAFVVGTITAWLGFVWFQRTRKGFADVV
jgi:lipopolysaccharide transport system permease protein